ncbi:MAG: argininosuccinate lyase [Rickettsiales bacterium]
MKKQKNTTNASNPMWGGHYERAPDALMAEINASIAFDHKLYRQDIAGSLAHVKMLGDTGILSKKESAVIEKGLRQVEKEIDAGKMAWKMDLEDIHMHVESRLKEIVGDVAGKLHTARSRNDQVATDFRLWVRDACLRADKQLQVLQMTLLDRAEQYVATVMPGFTHLQTAQPVTLGHHLMAYIEMLGRDRGRFADALERLNESPLGAAALAGTSFPIDRHQTAKQLGFKCPMENSLDAVSARDFALEYLSATAICSMHLSRLAEELVIWSSPQFGFIKLSEAFTTGSSIMPQKRNPDAAELIRAKAGRTIGALMQLFTVMKGLPLAYNKDQQEDKEPVFAADEHLAIALQAMKGMIADFTANEKRLKIAAADGYTTATDLADYLVKNLNMPFREAHHVTGKIVRAAEAKSCRLDELALEDIQKVEKRLTRDVFEVLSVEHSVKSRESYGGTAPKRVREAIKRARKKYA